MTILSIDGQSAAVDHPPLQPAMARVWINGVIVALLAPRAAGGWSNPTWNRRTWASPLEFATEYVLLLPAAADAP